MSKENTKIKLDNVRLSFPSLFKREVFEGKEGKYATTLLISKDDKATKKTLDAAIASIVANSKLKIAADKICLKDGDDSGKDGYENSWYIKASSERRPTIIDKDKSPLTEDDDKLYAGCYVNAIIDFWVQDNQFGKKVNANLYGVQFAKDGERFGLAPVDVTNDFEDIDL